MADPYLYVTREITIEARLPALECCVCKRIVELKPTVLEIERPWEKPEGLAARWIVKGNESQPDGWTLITIGSVHFAACPDEKREAISAVINAELAK